MGIKLYASDGSVYGGWPAGIEELGLATDNTLVPPRPRAEEFGLPPGSWIPGPPYDDPRLSAFADATNEYELGDSGGVIPGYKIVSEGFHVAEAEIRRGLAVYDGLTEADRRQRAPMLTEHDWREVERFVEWLRRAADAGGFDRY